MQRSAYFEVRVAFMDGDGDYDFVALQYTTAT